MVTLPGLIVRFLAWILLFLSSCSYAWNAIGHQVVAQIAFDLMRPETRAMCKKYSKSYNKKNKLEPFVSASLWMDQIRWRNIKSYDALHYIDIPFSEDNTSLPLVSSINALSAIKQAQIVLLSPKSNLANKSLQLRILTHVIADIHQPLHTVTRVSYDLPKGDRGGNLFPLSKNPVGSNLHQYWDRGGGLLKGKGKAFAIKNKAKQLEKKWSCSLAYTESKPEQWVDESHALAINRAYKIQRRAKPDRIYQFNVQYSTEKQLFIAGCRLAKLLDDIATGN